MDALPRWIAAVIVCGTAINAFAVEPAVPSPLQDDAALHDVQFTTANDGYAVGDHGTVWRTSDGGGTWRFVPSPTKASLRSASFLTNQIGWVAGVEWLPFARVTKGVLLRTTDGGQSWQPIGNGQLPGIEHVRFFDPEEGIAVCRSSPSCPSGVWTTIDSGKTWQPVSGPASPGWHAARFLAPDLGIVAGADGTLSLVGGEQLLPARLPSLGNRTIHDVTLNSAASGWLVGEGGLVLMTASGGASWQTPSGPLPESTSTIFDFRCVEQRGTHVWLAGAPGTIVWHSADRGKTWQAHPTGQTTPLHRFRFTSDSDGIAVGALGCILVTHDGGQSWQAVRGGGRRAALLVVPSRLRRFAPELLAPISYEQGYRTVVYIPANTTSVEAFLSRDAATDVLIATTSGLGGNEAGISRRLAVDLPGLDRDADKLQARWQAQSEGHASQSFLGSLLREIRMWRPSVVVVEEPALNDVYGDWVRQAVLAAVNQARDATRELDHFDAGLATWSVDRVYVQLPPGSHGETTFDLHNVLPHAGNSAQRYAAPWRSLWEPPLSPRDSLAFRCVFPNEQPGTAELFAGLNLAPGSGARRPSIETNPRDIEAVQKRIQRTRNLSAIAQKAERGSPRSAQLVAEWPQVARDWPPEEAAALLAEAAQRFRRDHEFDHAESLYVELVRRYPDQPGALDGLRWLLQYWTSAEVAWQRQKSRGVTQVQWTNDTSGLSNRLEQAQASGTSFAAAPRNFSEIVQARATQNNNVANRRPLPEGAVPDSVDTWRKRAADLAQQLEEQCPALFQQPEIQFPLAALKRARGSASNADAVYRRFQIAAPEDSVRQIVERELWLGTQTVNVPRKLATCRFTDTRPHLDGLFSDPCWEAAKPVTLGVQRDPNSSAAIVMFAWDAEFLYVAASVLRHPQASRDPVSLLERSHDADLSGHEWLGIALDIDRDYSTWYELRVDQRGWTSDRCWEDGEWDPKWYVAAEGEDTRWRVELAIPWGELTPRPPQAKDAWALSLIRITPALAEDGWEADPHWPPTINDFGLLRFEAQ